MKLIRSSWWLLIVLVLLCANGQQLVLEQQQQDHPLANANHIFRQVQGAGKAWWQAFAQNGRGVFVAEIPLGSHIYHGDVENATLEGVVWFATEPQHGWVFAKSVWANESTYLTAYRTTRKLTALYFDGHSAALEKSGSRDSQQVLIYGTPQDGEGKPMLPDVPLGEAVCKLAKELGFDAIVRQNSLIEIAVCEYDSSDLEVISNVPLVGRTGPPESSRRPGTELDTLPDSIYAHSMWVSAYRTVASRFQGEQTVVVRPEYMVSLYDEERYPSLAANNRENIRLHRLVDLSAADLDAYKRELGQVSSDWRHGRSSGIQWSAVTQTVINRYSPRLAELNVTLANATAIERDPFGVLHKVVLVLHSMLFPYIDAPVVLETWPSSSSPPAVRASLEHSKLSCSTALTPRTNDGLNAQERRIKRAIDEVLRQTCSTLIDLFGDALLSERAGRIEPGSFVRWAASLGELMDWLAWPSWVRPDRQCEWTDVASAFIKIWPFSVNESRTPYTDIPPPSCIRPDQLIKYRGFSFAD